MGEACLECGQDRRAHSAPDGGGCPGCFPVDTATILASLRRFVRRERALWKAHKESGHSELTRRSWEAAFDDMASAFDAHAERILDAAFDGAAMAVTRPLDTGGGRG